MLLFESCKCIAMLLMSVPSDLHNPSHALGVTCKRQKPRTHRPNNVWLQELKLLNDIGMRNPRSRELETHDADWFLILVAKSPHALDFPSFPF